MLVFYSWLCTCPYPGLLSIWFPSKWTCSPYHFTLYVLFVLSRSFLALSSTMNLYPQDVIHSIDNLRFDKQPSPSFLHGYAYLYDKLYSSSSLRCNQLEFWMRLRMYDILLWPSGLDATLYGHMHRSKLDFSPQDISLSWRRNPLYLPDQHNRRLCIESLHLWFDRNIVSLLFLTSPRTFTSAIITLNTPL